MLKAVLVDDEENSISSLKEKIIRRCPQVEIIATCDNAQKGIIAIDSLKPAMVFLDIEMPVMNGFLMLQQLAFKNFELVLQPLTIIMPSKRFALVRLIIW